MSLGYEINLKALCKAQSFKESSVKSADLVFPDGAVPNSQLLWVRVELKHGQRFFITLPLINFYKYVDLPKSSIGGWTEGKIGTDDLVDFRKDIVDGEG